jgi:uncharacterized protein (TIRG00374 family)
MSERKAFTIRRTSLLLVPVGIFVFVLYLYFYVPFVDFLAKIQQANPFYYSLAFAAMILSVAFYSLSWQSLLHLLAVKSSFLKAFQFVWVGSFVDLLVPAESISGDISRVYLMSRESGESAGKVVASVISHRVLSMTITLVGLVISSVYFVFNYSPPKLVLEFVGAIGACTLVSLMLIFYFSRNRQATEKVIDWIMHLLGWISRGRWKLEGLKKSAEKILKSFHDGIETLALQPRGLVSPISFATVAWAFDLLISVLVFHALTVQISISAVAIVYSITAAVQTIPAGIPGEVGILDVVMATLYTLLGVPIAVSAVATVLIRALTLWLRLLIGGVTVQWLGIKSLAASNTS